LVDEHFLVSHTISAAKESEVVGVQKGIKCMEYVLKRQVITWKVFQELDDARHKGAVNEQHYLV
jgi:hypothetical protein